MAECDWAILCDSGFQDLNRRACLIGVFDRVIAPSVPTLLPHATLVVKLLGSPGETCNFRVEVAQESGPPLLAADGNFAMNGSSSDHIFLNFMNVVLPRFGPYSLNVYIEGYLSKAATFSVQETLPPAQNQL